MSIKFTVEDMSKNKIPRTKGKTPFFGYTLQAFTKEMYVENPTVRAEIRDIFNRANDRIRSLTNASKKSKDPYVSPALLAIQDIVARENKKAKFTMNQGVDDILNDYARAVTFLQQKTSTVTESKGYTSGVKDKWIKYHNTDYGFDQFVHDVNTGEFNLNRAINKASDEIMIGSDLIKSLTQSIDQHVKVSINAIEVGTKNNNEELKETVKEAKDEFDNLLGDIADLYNNNKIGI